MVGYGESETLWGRDNQQNVSELTPSFIESFTDKLIIIISYLWCPEKKIGHITSFFELEAQDIDEKLIKFDRFKGEVTVVANVASYCGVYHLFMLSPEIIARVR